MAMAASYLKIVLRTYGQVLVLNGDSVVKTSFKNSRGVCENTSKTDAQASLNKGQARFGRCF